MTNTIGNDVHTAPRDEQQPESFVQAALTPHHQPAPNTIGNSTPAAPRGELRDHPVPQMRTTLRHDRDRDDHSDVARELNVLTVIPQGPILDLVSSALEGTGVIDHAIDLDDPEQVGNLCDDTCFARATRKLRAVIGDGNFLAGLFTHPGMAPRRSDNKGKKEDSRKAAAILLRMLTIIGMAMSKRAQTVRK